MIRIPNDRRRGMTLLEVLAVLVILGMATAVLATHFAVPTEHAKHDATIAAILDLDARARLVARSDGGASIAMEADRPLIHCTARDGSLISEVAADPDLELRLQTEPPVPKIRFDAAGRSATYRIEWKDGARARRIDICGETGWAEERTP
jgi:prepilin-type N-terminal cleavage/methylation domain-containing protein